MIQPREVSGADMRRGFAQSLPSILVCMMGACILIWGREAGLFCNLAGVSFCSTGDEVRYRLGHALAQRQGGIAVGGEVGGG